MKIHPTSLVFLTLACLFIGSCKRGPKVISTPINVESNPSNNDGSASTGIFSDSDNLPQPSTAPATVSDMHAVKVIEVLPTEKYVYLKVTENDEEFWVATGKKEIQVGQTYYYKNGILKTNFESKEYNRIFDKVYLVSNIVPADHSTTAGNAVPTSKISEDAPTPSAKIDVEGSIKISEIVANPKKYEGQAVQVSGTCSKINPNIMGRNWIHLKDGSQDDYDLVITSEIAIPEGHVVTMSGKVVLDKDFGAGYKYAIIIEDAQIVNLN